MIEGAGRYEPCLSWLNVPELLHWRYTAELQRRIVYQSHRAQYEVALQRC